MTKQEKLNYLKERHYDDYKKAREEAIQIVDNKFPIICCCGRIASGLHTSRCREFQKQVDNEIIRLLNKLLLK